MADRWGVLSEEGGRVTLHAVEDDALRVHDYASTGEAGARSGVAAGRLITLDARAQCTVPTAVLPDAPGRMGAVQQATPAALLPPAARILIAGALAAQPDWDGIVILPDTEVTHWVHVSAGEIVSFQGAATGRLAAALGAAEGESFDESALTDSLSRPERLAAQVNAAALTGATPAIIGHLLGVELAAMRAYWLGQGVRIIGDDGPHAQALLLQGVAAAIVPQAQAWQRGLEALGRATGLTN